MFALQVGFQLTSRGRGLGGEGDLKIMAGRFLHLWEPDEK